MAAKKTRKAVTPRKPKKRPIKKMKTRTKPKMQPAADMLELPSFLSTAEDNPQPPSFPASQPSAMPFNNSFEVAVQMIAMRPRMSNAVLSTLGVVEPPRPLKASDPTALHAEMIEQTEVIEWVIAEREHRRYGIGHNQPAAGAD